jgi:hypothetical protein
LQITEYLNISKPTALRTIAEIKAVGLVDEDEVMVDSNLVKRVTLRHEFDWFLSEGFAELNEDFKPVDYSEFLKEKDRHLDQRKEKLPPHTSCENDDASKENLPLTITNSLTSKLDDFWGIYDELETEQPSSPGSMNVDKNTVGGEDLR